MTDPDSIHRMTQVFIRPSSLGCVGACKRPGVTCLRDLDLSFTLVLQTTNVVGHIYRQHLS